MTWICFAKRMLDIVEDVMAKQSLLAWAIDFEEYSAVIMTDGIFYSLHC